MLYRKKGAAKLSVNWPHRFREAHKVENAVRASKKLMVDPALRVPYSISFWLANSSALLIGMIMVSTVRKAARLAV